MAGLQNNEHSCRTQHNKNDNGKCTIKEKTWTTPAVKREVSAFNENKNKKHVHVLRYVQVSLTVDRQAQGLRSNFVRGARALGPPLLRGPWGRYLDAMLHLNLIQVVKLDFKYLSKLSGKSFTSVTWSPDHTIQLVSNPSNPPVLTITEQTLVGDIFQVFSAGLFSNLLTSNAWSSRWGS